MFGHDRVIAGSTQLHLYVVCAGEQALDAPETDEKL
jgi:hypothetical protein